MDKLTSQTPTSTPPAADILSPGDLLSHRYRIERFLARGGMGEVYHAFDLELEIQVALKTIRADVASSPNALRRFKQEVLMARSISHPNVCRTYDLGRDEARGVSFLTMEFLAGETLFARIRGSGAMSPAVALPFVEQMTDALDAAHRAGIVHRDFKSANVMLVKSGETERAVITDFGLAIPEADDSAAPVAIDLSFSAAAHIEEFGRNSGETPETAETIAHDSEDEPIPIRHRLVGTPAYMAPEQVVGGKVGPAADLYALGVVLFEMTTARFPFGGASAFETAHARLLVPPPLPSTFGHVDENWERTILQLLAKEPGDRPASARDVALSLQGKTNEGHGAKYSLPVERDGFVGRATEVHDLAVALEGSGAARARILTLLGTGGTGKTRVVLRYGWDSLDRWPGGVWFCDLSEAQSVEGVAGAVAAALDVPLGKGDPVVQLGHAIAGRGRALVILDNFEQVIEHAEATLGAWARRCPDASFLVTSRERLGLDGESMLPLAPLDPTTHGAELFEIRARASRPGFEVDDANRDLVIEVVSKLDGLPLAIELAAARLRMLSLEQIRDRLQDRFKLLSGGKRGRHATLQAALDWSWDLLTPWEQAALAQASVFAGGFTLEAAEAVVDLSDYADAPLVLDVIQSLVDKSWLTWKVVLGAPRFDMYTSVQEYAIGKLRDVSSKARHGAYFAAMGSVDSLERLDSHGGVARAVSLELEIDNLVIACRRASDRKDHDTAVNAYVAAFTVLRFVGPFVRSMQLGEQVLSAISADQSAPPARLLQFLAKAEESVGKMQQAREHYEAALELCESAHDRREQAVLMSALGLFHREQGRVEQARQLYDAALEIHREIGNRPDEGAVLGLLGVLEKDQGQLEKARRFSEEALAIHREVGNKFAEGSTLSNLGIIRSRAGEIDEARKLLAASLAIHRESGNRREEGSVIGNLGAFHQVDRRMEDALRHYEEALAIHREVGNRSSEGNVLGNLGNLHHEQRNNQEAFRYYAAALAIHRELGNRRVEGNVLGNLAVLLSHEGRMEEAREHHAAALHIFREVKNRPFEAAVLENLGALERETGRAAESRDHYNAALEIYRELGDAAGEAGVIAAMEGV